MTPDAHTPCPACPIVVRDLYAVGRRVLIRIQEVAAPEYEELYLALEALRPWYEAHYANQLHAFSPELEDARLARHPVPEVRPLLELLAEAAL